MGFDVAECILLGLQLYIYVAIFSIQNGGAAFMKHGFESHEDV
jgi:hypothetical protein